MKGRRDMWQPEEQHKGIFKTNRYVTLGWILLLKNSVPQEVRGSGTELKGPSGERDHLWHPTRTAPPPPTPPHPSPLAPRSPLSADACSVAPEVPSMTLMAPRAVTARMALRAGW